MKLVPKIADHEILPGTIKIYADKASLDAIQVAVGEAAVIKEVNASTVVTVVKTSKGLHKLLSQVEASRKAAKADFLRANSDIDAMAKKLSASLKGHYDRLTRMLASWHDAETRRKEAEERARREEEERLATLLRKEEEERERQRQEILQRQAEAKTREELDQANLDLSFADADIPVNVSIEQVEIPSATQWPEYKPPIEGARTTKRYKFTLVDPVAAYQFSKQLVRWELSVLTAQDIVRSQTDHGAEPKIPGIQIESYTDVSTPSARG